VAAADDNDAIAAIIAIGHRGLKMNWNAGIRVFVAERSYLLDGRE
jgi:hypothetical protein